MPSDRRRFGGAVLFGLRCPQREEPVVTRARDVGHPRAGGCSVVHRR